MILERTRRSPSAILGGLAITLMATAAAASPEQSPRPTCIDASSSSSWTPHDDHTILVRSGGKTFRVTTNKCPALAAPLARISKEVQGGSLVCSPHDVRLYVSNGAHAIPVPCVAQQITPLTADQTRALDSERR